MSDGASAACRMIARFALVLASITGAGMGLGIGRRGAAAAGTLAEDDEEEGAA